MPDPGSSHSVLSPHTRAPLDTAPPADLPTPSWKQAGPGRTLVLALGLATVLGALFTVQASLIAEPDSRLWFARTFVLQSIQWWVWALLTPLVFGALDRWSPLGAHRHRRLVVHAALAVVVSALHAAVTASVVRAAGLAWTGEAVLDVLREALVRRFFGNVVTSG